MRARVGPTLLLSMLALTCSPTPTRVVAVSSRLPVNAVIHFVFTQPPKAVRSKAAPVKRGSPERAMSAEERWLSTPATRCIEFEESTDGKLSRNIFQFEGQTWFGLTGLRTDPGLSPVAVQDYEAYRLFLERGYEPWSSRFVCHVG